MNKLSIILVLALLSFQVVLAEGQHSDPLLYFDDAGQNPVPEYFQLIEDIPQTFYAISDNPDSADLRYTLGTTNLCEVVSSSTGQINCLVDHQVLTGTTDPAPETARNQSIFVMADDQINTIKYTNFYFELIPVNNQAYFIGTYNNVSILASDVWTLEILAEDQELDYPLNFTLIGDHPSSLRIENTSNNAAELYFDHPDGIATNEFAGTWNITINLTDNAGFNLTRSASQITFELEINATNFPPFFTTDFNDLIEGTQGELYELIITAQDPNPEDNITIQIQEPTNSSACPLDYFPWQNAITMTNNSALNATGSISLTLNNSHVICRTVNFRVDDEDFGFELIENVQLPIINVNDPPTLHEIGEHGNMSNQTAFTWARFIYQLNATDPDELTYNAHEFANLSYFSNDTERFPVDQQTGLINISLNSTEFQGVFTINFSVNDSEFVDWRLMTLEIFENNPPILNVSGVPNNFMQNDNILINFTARELDNENISIKITSLTQFNVSIYDLSFTNQSNGIINTFNYTINLTSSDNFTANSRVGHHSLNISLKDERNTSNQSSHAIINFTIENENDAPFFVQSPQSISPYEIELNDVTTGIHFEKIIFAQDFDLLLPEEFANESLTFTYSNETSNIINPVFEKMPGYENRALLSFAPGSAGNASILLRVTDNEGLFKEQNVSFEIFGQSELPIITAVKPFMGTYNSTFQAVYNFTAPQSGNLSVLDINFETTTTFAAQCERAIVTQIPPNHPYVFDINATLDAGVENNTAAVEWFVDGVSVLLIENATLTEDSQFVYSENLNQTKQINITAVITDRRSSQSSYTWMVLFYTDPRPPAYCFESLEDLEINGTTSFPDYFSYRQNIQRFYDPDEDLNMDGRRYSAQNEPTFLTYSVENPGSCGIISFSFSQDTLTLTPSDIAMCNVRFIATNEQGDQVISQEVTITVLDIVEQQTQTTSVTNPRPIPIPFEEEIDVPKPLRIIFPGDASLFANQTITVPIIIENTYTSAVRGISLHAEMPGHPDITYSFDTDQFQTINEGEMVRTTLTVENFRAEEAPYEIRVDVNVTDPSFTDSASIMVAGIEQSGAGQDREVRVTFARDLLSENPECQELNDYLDQADQILQSGDIEAARQLVDVIINGCRLLVQGEEIRLENPGLVRQAVSFSDENSEQIIIWVAILSILTVAMYITLSIKEKLLKTN